MRCLLCLFLLSGLSLAQPVDGPWPVVVSPYGEVFSDLHIAQAGPDRTAIFIVQDRDTTLASCRHGTFDWNQHGVLSDSFPAVWSVAGRRLTIGDAILLSPDSWAAVLYEEDRRVADNVMRNRALLASATPGQLRVVELDSGIVHQYGGPVDGDHWNGGFRLMERPGDLGMFVSWLQHGNNPVFPEPLNLIALRILDANLNPVAEYLAGDDNVYGPQSTNPVAIHADSVVVLGTIDIGNQSALCRLPPDPDANPWNPISCNEDWADFQSTRSGRWIALELGTADNVGSVIEISRDGQCQTLETFANHETWPTLAWNPAFGWIAARQTPGFIELLRVDTTGTRHLTSGIVYQTDLQHRLFAASVSIDDAGQIAVAWIEGLATDTAGSAISVARCSWDTPLSLDQPLFVPRPSALILSAYPNPFNSELRIDYTLPERGDVEISIFDLLGRRIESPADGMSDAGAHHTSWRPQCAAGLYFVTVRSGVQVVTNKVLYLK